MIAGIPMRPVGNRRIIGRTSVGILLSIIAHLVLFAVLFVWAPERTVKTGRDKVALKIVEKASRAELEKAPLVNAARPTPARETVDGQVVTLPEPPVQQVPDKARFLSQYDIKVDREQVSRRAPGTPGKPGRQSPRAKTTAAGRDSQVADARGDGQQDAPREAEVSQGGGGRDRAVGQTEHPTLPSIKGLGNMLLPGGAGGGRGSAMNMRMLADQMVADGSFAGGPGGPQGGSGGQGGSDDVFVGVEDEGDVTLVNSRSFKFWDFFDRIKGQVRSEWDPGPVYRSRDPDGKIYGRRDRYTILGVVLDGSGALAQLEVVHRSGLDFLDEEAVRAFQAAAPFPNPPTGLIDEGGRIVFRFGFMLEFGSSSGSFFWQRP